MMEKDGEKITMRRFAIIGKAKDVWRILELMAQAELDRSAVTLTQLQPAGPQRCPYDIEATCTKPHGISCQVIDCPVWVRVFGKA